jgi:lipoprotein-releasing system permease protein
MKNSIPTPPVSLFIAYRYLRSGHNKGFISFITSIAIIGVMLGVASLIITLSILDGFEKTIKENVVSFTADMQLFAFSSQVVPDADGTVKHIFEHNPEVTAIAPYVTREAMIRYDKSIDGIVVKGVDPLNDISAAKTKLVEGKYDLEERQAGIQTCILGKRLAEDLGVHVGGRVLLYGLGGTTISLSEARIMQMEVVEIYETGMAEFDGTYVYVNIRNAQRLFQIGSNVSGFDILVNDLSKLETLAHDIPADLGYPYYAQSMYRMHRNLFTWIELQKKPIPIILGLIVIVATVNIIGTLLMMVMEKSSAIGILRTLGLGRKKVVQIFLLQGLLIGVVGTGLGNILAFGICWLELRYRFFPLPSGIYFMTHVPIDLSFLNFFIVSASALFMCFLSSVLPARLASTLDPIKTLRFS